MEKEVNVVYAVVGEARGVHKDIIILGFRDVGEAEDLVEFYNSRPMKPLYSDVEMSDVMEPVVWKWKSKHYMV